jgi:hypothetical protein
MDGGLKRRVLLQPRTVAVIRVLGVAAVRHVVVGHPDQCKDCGIWALSCGDDLANVGAVRQEAGVDLDHDAKHVLAVEEDRPRAAGRLWSYTSGDSAGSAQPALSHCAQSGRQRPG